MVEHLRYTLGSGLVLRRGIVEALDERDDLVRLDEEGRYLHLDGVGVRRLVGSGIIQRAFLCEGVCHVRVNAAGRCVDEAPP